MFTGIIEDTGIVLSKTRKGDSIVFDVMPSAKDFLKDVKTGDSISINGACMTVESKTSRQFSFTTIGESLKKTNLGQLGLNDALNLEKAMTLNSKLDGHIVQGHVDTTGTLKKMKENLNSREFFFEFPSKYSHSIIETGSIAINGVSLTIAGIEKEQRKSILIKIAIIPHTYNVTNFREMKVNSPVNIEFDMMGKYIQRIISKNKSKN